MKKKRRFFAKTAEVKELEAQLSDVAYLLPPSVRARNATLTGAMVLGTALVGIPLMVMVLLAVMLATSLLVGPFIAGWIAAAAAVFSVFIPLVLVNTGKRAILERSLRLVNEAPALEASSASESVAVSSVHRTSPR